MDSTERTRRINALKEGLNNKNNQRLLDSALSSLLYRMYTVTSEIFYELVPLKRNENSEEEYEEYEEYDSDDDPTREEYNLIKNKLLDMIKSDNI